MEDYKIIRQIRSGTKTTSFLATDNNNNKILLTYLNSDKIWERHRFMAYKKNVPADKLDEEANKNLETEWNEFKETALRTKGFGNEHVAYTIGVGFDSEKNQPIIISEYCPGIDIFYATRGLTPTQMLSLFAQILEGIKFIHKRGLLHLNIKPSRIRVDLESIPPVVKLTDFGFAIPQKGFNGEYHGTALYMAPEIVFNEREKVDVRADLYSFGILAYYCLTERHPTEARIAAEGSMIKLRTIVDDEMMFSPPSHFNRDISKDMDKIILNLLERDPDKRVYKTAEDLTNIFYKIWPGESREMPHEKTSTIMES